MLSRTELGRLSECLSTVHEQFAKLYAVKPDAPGYAIEVEFKITKDGVLSIKHARP